MLKKEDIKNGKLVFNQHGNTYHFIENVGNAREKGDRDISSTPLDELSYTLVDLITKEKYEGICEHSHMTSNRLSVANETDIDIYLLNIEADALLDLSKAKKQYAVVSDAVNRFKHFQKSWLNNKSMNEEKNEPKNPDVLVDTVSGSTDIFGTIMVCLPKYSNCQLCKYEKEPQNSDVCTYCSKHNKSTEYYR